jgi:hypothetical protein
MDTNFEILYYKAIIKYGDIEPCSGKTLEGSVTNYCGKTMLWFNCEAQSGRGKIYTCTASINNG